MWPRYETITDLGSGADLLASRRCGLIEAAGGRFQRIVLRPVPIFVSGIHTVLLGGWHHSHREGDRCRVYFNQPRRFENFLAVKYVVSSRGTAYDTCRRVFEALDEVARIKGIDAMVCDLANRRITGSIVRRWGWEPHKPSLWHRHYIKRFYGEYPPRAKWLESQARV